MPRVPFVLLGSFPPGVESVAPLGPSVIPGFAPEMPVINSDAELYGEPCPRPAMSPRLGRDHLPGSSSDADLYGTSPRNLSPPRGSEHSKSSQVDENYDRQLIRRFDTSTLLYVIPEVRSHSTIYAQRLEADDTVASFPSCAFCGPFCRSPIAYSTFQ